MLTRETPLTFGRQHRLFGLLTEPSGATGAPTVIVLNAGLIHRVGPRRLHVKLARRLAAQGFPVFRMDLSGIGDSESRRDALPAVDGVRADVREAMDFLAQDARVRSFLLVGICSGAKISYQVALTDARVAGGVLVDPGDFGQQATTSPASGDSAFVQHYVKHYWRNVFAKGLSWKRVAGWFTGKANYAYARKVVATQLRGLLGGRKEARATKTGLRSEFEALAARGVRLLLAYGDAGASRVFYDMMLKESVERGALAGSVAVRVLPDTNHTFVSLASQAALLRAVDEWIAPFARDARRGGAASPAGAAAAVTAGGPSGPGG